MTLYTVTQPDPPVGTDFTFTVPGRYLYDVVGITATLQTGTTPSPTMADASGNGNDGTYAAPPTYVPGIVAGDLAIDFPSTNTTGADVTNAVATWTGDWSIEWWLNPVDTGVQTPITARAGSGPINTVFVNPQVGGTQEILFLAGNTVGAQEFYATANGVFPIDGQGHHVVVTYVAGTDTMACYIDGAAVTLNRFHLGVPSFVGIDNVFVGEDPAAGGQTVRGILDEPAVYSHALSAGAVAAHYAAKAAGFSAYAAAVLADTPAGYWHLDDEIGGTGRQPSLIVTNGTTELEAIPTGFPAVGTPGPYEYSWQPALNADVQSTDGTLTTVAIPQLLLPAGYTVGVRTLDIQPTDQWLNVALWWDDAYQQAFDPFNDYNFPGGVKLVYQQQGAMP